MEPTTVGVISGVIYGAIVSMGANLLIKAPIFRSPLRHLVFMSSFAYTGYFYPSYAKALEESVNKLRVERKLKPIIRHKDQP